jgi:hypothetical protein
MYIPQVGSYSFSADGDEVRVVPAPHASEQLIRSGYLRTVLPMAVQVLGREVLHASAVLGAGGVVAFCAVSTTGKSTLAAALNRDAYPLWADDAVAFEGGDGTMESVALPFEVPAGSGETGTPPSRRAPLAAVCVLERSSAAMSRSVIVSRLAPSDAFLALLTHAYCYSLEDVDRHREMIDHYLDAARSVPVYRVIFEPGLDRLPATLDAIESEIGMSPPTSFD